MAFFTVDDKILWCLDNSGLQVFFNDLDNATHCTDNILGYFAVILLMKSKM